MLRVCRQAEARCTARSLSATTRRRLSGLAAKPSSATSYSMLNAAIRVRGHRAAVNHANPTGPSTITPPTSTPNPFGSWWGSFEVSGARGPCSKLRFQELVAWLSVEHRLHTTGVMVLIHSDTTSSGLSSASAMMILTIPHDGQRARSGSIRCPVRTPSTTPPRSALRSETPRAAVYALWW